MDLRPLMQSFIFLVVVCFTLTAIAVRTAPSPAPYPQRTVPPGDRISAISPVIPFMAGVREWNEEDGEAIALSREGAVTVTIVHEASNPSEGGSADWAWIAPVRPHTGLSALRARGGEARRGLGEVAARLKARVIELNSAWSRWVPALEALAESLEQPDETEPRREFGRLEQRFTRPCASDGPA